MKPIRLDSLANELAKPGFERELVPLLMYKGSQTLGRVQRLWNLTVAMMMHEADSLSEGITHLHMNEEWSQLCFPDRRVQHCSMRGFFNRLRDNTKVTNLVPGLTDYVAWLQPRYSRYERVPLEAERSRRAWWRVFVPKRVAPTMPENFEEIARNRPNWLLAETLGVTEYYVAKWKEELGIEACRRGALPPPTGFFETANGKSQLWTQRHYGRSQGVIRRWFKETGAEPASLVSVPLAYPYLLHEGCGPEHELLKLINAAVPHHLPPDLRADMCQDLAVGCLTGDFNKEDLLLPAREVVKRVARMFPTKYGPVSLDAPILGSKDLLLLDTLIDEGRDWA